VINLSSWPHWQSDDGAITLICADCLAVLADMAPGSVDCIVADPPYGMENDVDSRRFTGGHNPERRGAGGGRFRNMIVGDDLPFDPTPFLQYQQVILWGANHYANRLPSGTTLVWVKRNDAAFGSFLSDAEIAWQKGGCGVYCCRDLSMRAEERFRVHPNQKPIPLMEWCINRTSGTVCDPFTGSGSIGVACIRTGRRFVGVEIDPGYYEIAKARIIKELEQKNGTGPLIRASLLDAEEAPPC
jgi:site-specific DNA-methyltransferase (adenine-specific)